MLEKICITCVFCWALIIALMFDSALWILRMLNSTNPLDYFIVIALLAALWATYMIVMPLACRGEGGQLFGLLKADTPKIPPNDNAILFLDVTKPAVPEDLPKPPTADHPDQY